MDNPNLNDKNEDFSEWWEGVVKEEEAKADKMDAEERMAHTKMLEDFRSEAEAGKDWMAADWEQFKARVQQWTNKAETKADEAI
ncbi:MAG TPA: hypothetical protein VF696_01670 [Candidatus Paceibacterota bacterium]